MVKAFTLWGLFCGVTGFIAGFITAGLWAAGVFG